MGARVVKKLHMVSAVGFIKFFYSDRGKIVFT
jgi:hypothetical protein